MDHSKAAKGKETKKDLSIGGLMDKIIKNLDNSLGLVSQDYCAQAIVKIVGDLTTRTAGRFMEIIHKILQTDFYSSKETGLTDDELELTVLMYFAIAQDLKEKALPGANYYYDLAYRCHPIEDLALNPYKLLYARSLNTISPHSRLELQRIIALYSEISRVQFSMEAALAELKLALLNNKTFANVKLDLDALIIKHPPLASSINAEKAWTELCDYAKNLRSKNPSIQALLDYLRQTTVLDYPSIKQDQLGEDLKLANEDDDKKLLALLDLAKKSRNTNPPITDIINSDKTAEALRIYYGPITEKNVNGQKAALNLVQSLRKNNCNSFYYFYQNYDALSKNRAMIQLCRGSILQETPPIYFLEMAAWNGNREAQYELSKHYLAQHLERGAKDISLKGKWLYFLELAANNNVAEAQYDLSVAIKSKKISAQDGAEFLYLHDASSNGHQMAVEECVRLQEYIDQCTFETSKTKDKDLVQPKTSGQETIKIALAELGKKLEDPLGFVDHDEHSKILILELCGNSLNDGNILLNAFGFLNNLFFFGHLNLSKYFFVLLFILLNICFIFIHYYFGLNYDYFVFCLSHSTVDFQHLGLAVSQASISASQSVPTGTPACSQSWVQTAPNGIVLNSSITASRWEFFPASSYCLSIADGSSKA